MERKRSKKNNEVDSNTAISRKSSPKGRKITERPSGTDTFEKTTNWGGKQYTILPLASVNERQLQMDRGEPGTNLDKNAKKPISRRQSPEKKKILRHKDIDKEETWVEKFPMVDTDLKDEEVEANVNKVQPPFVEPRRPVVKKLEDKIPLMTNADIMEKRRQVRDYYTFTVRSKPITTAVPSKDMSNRIAKAEIPARPLVKSRLEFTINGIVKPGKKSYAEIEDLVKEEPSIDSLESYSYRQPEAVYRKPALKADDTERRPLIKTIKSTGTSKTYKSVSFVDQKKHPTQLQINIPTEPQKKPVSMRALQNLMQRATAEEITRNISKVDVSEVIPKTRSKLTTTKIKEKRRRKKSASRRSSPLPEDQMPPPFTEVAKYAPSSIDNHTQPYYEAWVDTTLASRNKERTLVEQVLANSRQTLNETPSEMDMLLFPNEEKYMGRIRIRR